MGVPSHVSEASVNATDAQPLMNFHVPQSILNINFTKTKPSNNNHYCPGVKTVSEELS